MYFDYNIFQKEVHEWSIRNFGEGTATQKLCGIIEEYYELESSLSPVETRDAIGDIMIYVADYASILGISLSQIVIDTNSKIITFDIIGIFGRLCHHTLKYEQRIRMDEKHIASICIFLKCFISILRTKIDDPFLRKLNDITKETWDVVKKRDWKKNAEKGII